MYLLDTMIVSELRRRRPDANVVRWLGSLPSTDVFVSVVTVAEIERGIERQRMRRPEFAEELVRWLDVILRVYGDRVLPITTAVARRWGRLASRIPNNDMDLGIAATAMEHGLIVATRNLADFDPTGVPTLNPFALPDSQPTS